MALVKKSPAPKPHRPSLTPKEASIYSGGALSYEMLKRDRAAAEANGTPPAIPFYRLGHRSVRYRPDDIDAYLDSMRIE